MVLLVAGTICSGEMIGWSPVPSWRRRSSVETGGILGALELRVLVISPGRVVWDDVLHGTREMVPDGGRTDDSRLSPLLISEHWVLFCNAEMATCRSETDFSFYKQAPFVLSGIANGGRGKRSEGRGLD